MSDHTVIIGAGVVGALCAIAALDRGLAVTLLDPGEPGGEQAASFGNAAWFGIHSVLPPGEPGVLKKVPGYLADPLGPLAIRPSYLPRAAPWLLRYARAAASEAKLAATARALHSLLADAPALHETVARAAGIPELVALTGVLHVYPDRDAYLAEARSWRIRRDFGLAVEELDADALREREPTLDPAYRFAAFVPAAGHCRNPGAYVAGLVAHAVARGARLVRAAATGFVIDGTGRLAAVVTDGGEVPADSAVIAAGIRSAALARAAGDRVPLESEGGYHVTVAGPPVTPRIPMMIADRKVAVTPIETGLRVAGQVEIAGPDARPDWRRAEILLRHAAALFPGLGDATARPRVTRWHGHRPSTPDGLPVIGRSRASAGVIHAFGHGHVGLAASARTGQLVADLLTGGAPSVPPAPFDPRRF